MTMKRPDSTFGSGRPNGDIRRQHTYENHGSLNTVLLFSSQSHLWQHLLSWIWWGGRMGHGLFLDCPEEAGDLSSTDWPRASPSDFFLHFSGGSLCCHLLQRVPVITSYNQPPIFVVMKFCLLHSMIHFTLATLKDFNSFQKVGVGKEGMKSFASSLLPPSSFYQDDDKLKGSVSETIIF